MKRLWAYKAVERKLRKAAKEIDKKLMANMPNVVSRVMERIEQEQKNSFGQKVEK